MAVGLVEGEGITLERRLVEAVEVISIKTIYNLDEDMNDYHYNTRYLPLDYLP